MRTLDSALPFRLRLALASAVVLLSCLRLAHVHLLWADEDYHIAAAMQILHGKIPYRDFWYDKPPLSAVFYTLIGASSGWPLRLLDAAYILAACALCFRLARLWWSELEAWTAALLFAFFTTFYLPSSVIAFAADAIMIVPHLAAIYFAASKRPLWAGFFAGLAFLVNVKALFVLLVCGLWLWPEWLWPGLGFAIPAVSCAAALVFGGAWRGYIEQVWRWGMIYATGSPVTDPFRLGFVRTADWLGFHAALLLGTAFALATLSRELRWKLGSWLALSFAAVCLGTRFAPHYFLQLLPPMAIAASRGLALAFRERRKIAVPLTIAALLVPLIRFGPRYVSLAFDGAENRPPVWSDAVLDLDSQAVAQVVRRESHPGDTLFVWGYRPDVYVYTRLIPPGLFWDSQPLDGIPADRHLSATGAIYSGPAAANRLQFVRTKPTFVVDGLGVINPRLRPEVFADLRPWLAHYHLVARTKLSAIYELNTP